MDTEAPTRPQEAPDTSGAPRLSWPPPGMGGSQGEAWRMLGMGAVGGALLVVPLLAATANEHPFWSLGPLGRPWWILPVLSVVGFLVLGSFLWRLFLLLLAGARAADRGYGLRTILLVAADGRRDTGFLLQGARYYEDMSAAARRGLLRLRVVGVALYLGATLWVPLGCAVSLLLASRGVLDTGAVWLGTFAPAALMAILGTLIRAMEERPVREAKRQWYAAAAKGESLDEEVQRWNRGIEEGQPEGALGVGRTDAAATFRRLRVLNVALAVLVAAPALTLALAAVVGPAVASVALPRLNRVQSRLAGVEPYRRFRLAADPSITALEAGEALHSLLYVADADGPSDMERDPVRTYDGPLFPETPGVMEGLSSEWTSDLIQRVAAGGLSTAERAYLDRIVDHPAWAEMETLARAGSMDIIAGRFDLPLPDTVPAVGLVLPDYSVAREGAYLGVARAANALDQGRMDDAEEALRTAMSAGFLLADEAPTILGGLIGVIMASSAGRGLADFYAAAGRADEADLLRQASSAAAEAASTVRRAGGEASLETRLQELPRIVEQRAALRGLRWEYFAMVNTTASCLNLHTAVYGPGESHDQWVERVRQELVRLPGEEAFFELSRGGLLGQARPRGVARVLQHLLGLTLGGGETTGSCAVLTFAFDI